ncbi:MAG: STAS domain-containing protein [bacterium]|nr:STAS domain-containing protein [bacterium]
MEKLKIELSQEQGIVIMKLIGYLDAETAPKFDGVIIDLMQQGKFKLIVNLSKLDYISSAGLGVLMGKIGEIRAKGGDIVISSLPQKIFRVLQLLGFSKLFKIVETDEEGFKAF